MNLFKVNQLSISSLTSLMNLILLSQNALLISIKMIDLSKSNKQLAIKFLSSKLNTRPYNRLDKEVIDFKECKEGLIMPHNTKCSYLGTGTL